MSSRGGSATPCKLNTYISTAHLSAWHYIRVIVLKYTTERMFYCYYLVLVYLMARLCKPFCHQSFSLSLITGNSAYLLCEFHAWLNVAAIRAVSYVTLYLSLQTTLVMTAKFSKIILVTVLNFSLPRAPAILRLPLVEFQSVTY